MLRFLAKERRDTQTQTALNNLLDIRFKNEPLRSENLRFVDTFDNMLIFVPFVVSFFHRETTD